MVATRCLDRKSARSRGIDWRICSFADGRQQQQQQQADRFGESSLEIALDVSRWRDLGSVPLWRPRLPAPSQQREAPATGNGPTDHQCSQAQTRPTSGPPTTGHQRLATGRYSVNTLRPSPFCLPFRSGPDSADKWTTDDGQSVHKTRRYCTNCYNRNSQTLSLASPAVLENANQTRNDDMQEIYKPFSKPGTISFSFARSSAIEISVQPPQPVLTAETPSAKSQKSLGAGSIVDTRGGIELNDNNNSDNSNENGDPRSSTYLTPIGIMGFNSKITTVYIYIIPGKHVSFSASPDRLTNSQESVKRHRWTPMTAMAPPRIQAPVTDDHFVSERVRLVENSDFIPRKNNGNSGLDSDKRDLGGNVGPWPLPFED
ncbi:hypothetical protein WN48_06265 [Eufriesea mexicana]|nr:hypothetical protein WN48_06265 [Eufriesea mexicana]